METFCAFTNVSVSSQVLLCQISTVQFFYNVAFAYACVLILVYTACALKKSRAFKTADCCTQPWPAHNFRWLSGLTLILTNCADLADWMLQGPAFTRPFSGGSPLASLIATLTGCVYYDRLEKWRQTRPLIWTLPFWLFHIVAAVLKGVFLPETSVLVAISAVQSVLYLGLFVTDAIAVTQGFLSKNSADDKSENVGKNLSAQSSDSVFTPEDEIDNSINKSQRFCYLHRWSNFLSKASYFWLCPLLVKGFFNPLELEHLGKVPEPEQAKTRQEVLEKYIDDCAAKKRKLSLWHCYWSLSWPMIVLGGIFKFLGDSVGYVAPLGIRVIINYVNRNASDTTDDSHLGVTQFFSNGFVMAFVVFISALCQGALSQASSHVLCMEGIRLKTSLQSVVYAKCLKLPSWGVEETHERADEHLADDAEDDTKLQMEPGTLSNLLTEDCSNVMIFVCLCHYIWAIPLKIIILLYLLHQELSTGAVIASLLCLFIMIPLQFVLGKKISSSNRETMKFTDLRLQYTHEWLSHMKLLRLYAWEQLGKSKIDQVRDKELALHWRYSLLWACATFLTQASTVLLTSLTFVLYPIFSSGLKPLAANAFTGLALMNQFTVPLFILPVVVPELLAAKNSTARLTKLLEQPEVKERVRCDTLKRSMASSQSSEGATTLEKIAEEDESCSGSPDIVVRAENASFAWQSAHDSAVTEQLPSCVLNDITLEIPRGSLTAIIGSVGSGKSSLISALLGELVLQHGSLLWSRDASATIGLVSQKPWLLHASLRDNILFGSAANDKRYAKVVSACALEQDISSFPDRDATVVLSGGTNLSGGQKVRVALARALYSRAAVVLLDDPFSALDTAVAEHVFQHAIQKGLIRQRRTVILATHHVNYAKMADHVIVLESGKIALQGSPKSVAEARPGIFETRHVVKTARHRWQLLRIVAKTSSVFNAVRQRRADDEVSRSRKWKRRSSRLNALSRHMSHDIPLLTDEIVIEEGDEVIDSSAVSRRSLATTKRRSRKLSSDASSIGPVANTRSYSLSLKVSNPLSVFRRSRRDQDEQLALQHVSLQPGGDNVSTSDARPTLRRLLSTPESSAKKPYNRKASARESFFRTMRFSSSGHASSVSSVGTSIGIRDARLRPSFRRLTSTVSGFSEDTEVELDSDRGLFSDPAASEEERQYGRVSRRLYWYYAKACGFPTTLAYLLFTLGWQASRLLTDYWLRNWTDSVSSSSSANNSSVVDSAKEDSLTGNYLWTYVLLSAVSVVAALLSNIIGQAAGSKGRRELHNGLLSSLLSCQTRVFEMEPTGRLLNRFSTDMAIIDKKLGNTFQRLLQFVLLCVSAVAVNAIISPWTLLLAVPIMLVFYALQRFFRTSARELQRLESLTKGPIISHLSETLCGLGTLRAFGQQKRFLTTMYEITDPNTAAVIVLNCSNRWLGLAVDSLGACILFVATVTALIAHKQNAISSGLVGLAINYTLLTPIYLQWVVRSWSDLEMYFNAVERVLHYSRFKSEDQILAKDPLPDEWPSTGEVVFDRVCISYDEKTPVVKDLSFRIDPGQKIGICGRTGSGKTTVTNAILRMAHVSSGKIDIDGIDLRLVHPKNIRSRLAVVPQDFLLLSGSLRENLDPAGEFDDSQLWDVLEKVKLKEFFANNGLESEIWENGANLSLGQQQLLSLARAALRKSNVVILDEPSSSLDTETEKVFHKCLRDLFHGRTILMIAHRESSLLECDRLILMEDGCVVMQGTPAEVLSRIPANRL